MNQHTHALNTFRVFHKAADEGNYKKEHTKTITVKKKKKNGTILKQKTW